MLNRAVALDIEGLTFQVELSQDDAPLAAKAFLEQLPFEGVVVHSMWSGPMGLMGPVNLNEAPLENASAFLTLGDIAYHPRAGLRKRSTERPIRLTAKSVYFFSA